MTCGILTRKNFLTWVTGRVMMAEKQVSEKLIDRAVGILS